MHLHFSEQELADRRRRTCDELARQGLDGLLIFKQESMYYLTGFDSYGYVFFQCLFLGVDGSLTLITRSPDLRQARYTSIIQDIRIWVDAPDADPSRTDLKPMLEEKKCRGKRLGIEWNSYGLTAQVGRQLASALEGFCDLVDMSDLVSRQRVLKSPAELVYVRRASELADEVMRTGHRFAVPGAFEGDIMAEMQSVVFRGGGDDTANEYILSSGPASLVSRYLTGRRHLDADDQLNIEFCGVYRHYHCGLYHTIKVGKPNPRHREMYMVALDCLDHAKNALRPGAPIGNVFDAYARTLEKHGYASIALNSCGYSLGATYAPTWMDWPMFYRGSPTLAAPNMVFFVITGVRDDARGLIAVAGETVLVTPTGHQRLSALPLDYWHNP